MSINKARLRQLHSMLAPIMVLPILLTLITGFFYQMADVAGKQVDFLWLLDLHKGNFGLLNLEVIYPFLNALGLFTLAITGTTLWFQTRRRPGN
ncbi:PepSY domain-containing protein [Microcoleus sp. FACHB-68]|uniref:PepSY domain-containing protein n=1 Tax=Microcoleus sp. FACHB-68 TaxID=2692826 RepID=UPI00168277CF|nr:PepSY domain-containing protein [Microcoleus sp. FACHB-68]MBD1939878.1 PepSY domain-containing protein [Microcoleus sp. FACHB-68]